TRARCARLLGLAADPDAVDDLARACGDAEWPVRLEALRAWVATAPDGVEPKPLLASLDDGEELVRVAALEGLVERGDLGAVSPARLPELAGQANLEARIAALELVRGSGTDVEREVAMLLRQDPADGLRAEAFGALGALCDGPDDPAFATLLAALDDGAEEVRAVAASALGRFDEVAATQALVRATFEAGPRLREEVTAVLAARGLDALNDELDTFMASDREEARLAVLWTLGKIADPRGVPLLTAALQDPRPRVRASAVGALAKIPTEEARLAVRGPLTDPDARTRAAAVNAVARLGGEPGPLRRALEDPDAFVRGRAYIAAGRSGDEESRGVLERALMGENPVPALMGLALLGGPQSAASVGRLLQGPLLAEVDGALQTEDQVVRERVRAFLGIAQPGADRATWLGGLRRALQSSRDPDERLRALELLASFELDDLLGRLGAVVGGDPDPRVRVRAMTLLAEHGRQGDPALIRGLRDPDAGVRLASLQAGVRLGLDAGAAVLACADGTPHLHEASAEALAILFRRQPLALADLLMGASLEAQRLAAVAALGRIGDRSIIPLLVALLDDTPAIRFAAVAALAPFATLEGIDAIDALEAASQDPEASVRSAALAALVQVGESQDGWVDAALRGEPQPDVRAAVVQALGMRTDGGALTLLTQCMSDAHPTVRRAALLSVLRVPTSMGLGRFVSALEASDPVEAQVVRTAVHAQGLGDGVRRALQDGPRELRVAAAEVLSCIDASRYEDALLHAATDPTPAVRLAALHGLIQCNTDAARHAVVRAARDEDDGVSSRARAAVGER
ncbi:MAG: HEAT repeat domain-containing protein, partial [Deltaproteobacteria bacterium]|nr:HEAT repeat domain-containing protein [Deltaproteobacteria bacterium]